MEVNIHEAKTHFSRLLQRVAAGEEITIARAGVPVAKLVAVERKQTLRPLDFRARPGVGLGRLRRALARQTAQSLLRRQTASAASRPETAAAKTPMKYLLDSGVWLWSIDSVERIGKRGLAVLSDSRQEIYFSAASAWELSIKAHLRKLTLPAAPGDCIPPFMADRVCGLCP